MDNGITISGDLFDKSKKLIFFFDEQLGTVEEQGTGVLVQPINQKPMTAKDMEQAVEYLMEIRNRQFKKVTAKTNPAQVALW